MPAFTTGWRSPTAISASGWTNPNNALAADDARATITRATAGETAYFRAYGFGFSVPTNATNIRIEFQFEGQTVGTPDYSYFFAGDVLAGTPQSVTSFGVTLPISPAAEAYSASLGGATVDWGGVDTNADNAKDRDWLPGDVNATNFGISGAWGNTGSLTVSLDHVQGQVWFDLPLPSSGMLLRGVG